MDEQTYSCPICGKLLSAPKDAAAPVCCGKPMEPLPFCTKPPVNPEAARLTDADEPCDDGTLSKKK
jgi:hypothetical protein